MEDIAFKTLSQIQHFFFTEITLYEISIFYMFIFVLYKISEHYFFLKKDVDSEKYIISITNRNILFLSIVISFEKILGAYINNTLILLSTILLILVILFIPFKYFSQTQFFKKRINIEIEGTKELKIREQADKQVKRIINNKDFDFFLYVLVIILLFLSNIGWEYWPLYVILLMFLNIKVFFVTSFVDKQILFSEKKNKKTVVTTKTTKSKKTTTTSKKK